MTTVKATEIRDLVWKTVCDYTKARLAAGKPASPSIGLVHAGLMVKILAEVESTLTTEELNDPAVLAEYRFVALAEVENGSALRQKLASDKVGILPKEGKATSVAADYM